MQNLLTKLKIYNLIYVYIKYNDLGDSILNILIIGCGQLGSQLATMLDYQNHSVAIIGPKQILTNNLNEDFSGILVPGNPIDIETIKSAGVENCHCVICVAETDNKNIMAAQIVKHFFKIENIVVRILDPEKCEIYSKMGFSTISPTLLAFDSIYSKIFKIKQPETINFAKNSLKIKTLAYEKWMKNRTFIDLEFLNDNKLIGFLNEKNELCLFSKQTNRTIRKTDQLVYAILK